MQALPCSRNRLWLIRGDRICMPRWKAAMVTLSLFLRNHIKAPCGDWVRWNVTHNDIQRSVSRVGRSSSLYGQWELCDFLFFLILSIIRARRHDRRVENGRSRGWSCRESCGFTCVNNYVTNCRAHMCVNLRDQLVGCNSPVEEIRLNKRGLDLLSR